MAIKSVQTYRRRLSQPSMLRQGIACGELARLGYRAARELRILAGDKHPMVRLRAGYAMGVSGDRRFLPDLLPLLFDPVMMVRYDTAYALGYLGDKRAVPHLLRQHRVSESYRFSPRGRCRSTKRIQGCGPEGFGSWRQGTGCWHGVELLGEKAVPRLKAALASPFELDRRMALDCLRRIDPAYFVSLKDRFLTDREVGWHYCDLLYSHFMWPPEAVSARKKVRRPSPIYGLNRRKG